MNKATVILAIVGVALLATALIGITYAQLATPNPTATPASPDVSAPYCYSSANSVPPYCYNGTATNTGCGFGCHGYGAQGANQYQYGGGMMGRGW